MRGECWGVALGAALAAASGIRAQEAPLPSQPSSLQYCYQDQFALAPGPYQRARAAKGAKPSLVDAADDCIRGPLAKCKGEPLEPTSAWIAGAKLGDWICVSDGSSNGWVKAGELVLEPVPERPVADWVGTWDRSQGDAQITLKAESGKGLAIAGQATWSSGPGALPRTGELEGKARPVGVELMLGDRRCVAPDRADKTDTVPACLECNARLLLVGETLIVTDNRMCGGMNVNFDGLYHRTR